MATDQPLATLMLTSDPQIGLYRAALELAEENPVRLGEAGRRDAILEDLPHIEGFERESLLFREAIAAANDLRPDAMIVCGDMLQDWDSDEQAALAHEIAAGLDDRVPLLWVAGNHDIAPDSFAPSEESLAGYRALFGPDRYVVTIESVRAIVINSTAVHSDALPGERAANLDFLEAELATATERGEQPVVCSHHPWFLLDPNEVPASPATGLAIPPEPRRRLLEIAKAGALRTLLTGHMHQHMTRTTGDLQQITTSAIGLPFGEDPSGYRVIRIFEDHVEHEAHDLPSGPRLHPEAQRIWAARQYQFDEPARSG